MPTRTVIRVVILALVIAVTAASVLNVFADNRDVIAAAALVGCGSEGCASPEPTRIDRTPFGQSFEFVTRAHKTVAVRCTRAALAVGAYTCVKE
jgi:hypothetical protein